MNQPLISIIITVLNGEKTIRQCLESIAKQTFTGYEVVIVDGGSSDETVSIVNEVNLPNKRLHIIPGLGLYAGLNAGIKQSVGQWLYFIGCDDELNDSVTLENVANVINEDTDGAKVFVGSVACVKQDNVLHPKFGSPYLMKYQVHHQGMFYNRHVFDNLLYDENRRIISDYELNLKLALNKVPHQYMDLIICRFGGDGISENQAQRGYVEMQEVHKQIFKGWYRILTLTFCSLQHNIVLARKRLNLVNLKVRFKRLVFQVSN